MTQKFGSAEEREFDQVRAVLARSLPGRAWSAIGRRSTAAWRTSFFAAAIRRVAGGWRTTTADGRISAIALMVAVASALQLLLIQWMPLTIRPAVPAIVFVVVAMLAAIVAWRADAIARSWPSSRFARILR